MLFNSFIFLIFLAVVVPFYYLLPRRYRNVFLLISSYVFYGYWDWRFLSLIVISTLVDYFVGGKLYVTESPAKRKILLSISLIANLGLLGFFKYFNFFIDSFEVLCRTLNVRLDYVHLKILLPVGISFYTFQTLSYTIDIYRGKLKPTRSPLDFALFVAFFPQLVAGPIERAVNLLPQIARRPTPTREDFKQGFALITLGMFKKVMIGDTCGRIVDQIFASPECYNSSELMMALILFSFQIYADFSGYSNIARGTARFLGIRLMENFNQPYLSSNITEFWRRWHISLSSWLKDYLYISLGGNRRGRVRTYVNLMLTMLLGGLWHGANWTFVFWGGLHGLYLAAHKVVLGNRKPQTEFHYTTKAAFAIFLVKVVATNVLVLITWLFFRAKTFGSASFFLMKFLHWESSEFSAQIVTIVFTYFVVVFVLDFFEYYYRNHAIVLYLRPPVRVAVYIVVWYIILLYMYQAPPMPFIYFQF